MIRVHSFHHVPFEGIASIQDWIQNNGHSLSGTRFYNNYQLPDMDSFEMLVIMGGPMNVNEERKYPWLIDEKAFIRQAIAEKKVIIGVCLGAQLIASALGARVYPNRYKEIGWWPVSNPETYTNNGVFSLNDPLTVFHWHGDTFDLPDGAVHLYSSEGCVNQAFLYHEKVLGLQFHFEATPESVMDMVIHGDDELAVGGMFVHTRDYILKQKDFYEGQNRMMFRILDHMALKCS